MLIYMCIYVCTHVCSPKCKCPWNPKEGICAPETGVAGRCEPPDRGSGTQTFHEQCIPTYQVPT